MKKRGMDFRWRPFWSVNQENDMLTNLMPYWGYWLGDVCGPDQNICKQFNFLHLPNHEAQAVTELNVNVLADLLYKAYRFTSRIYQYKTLVIFLGEDASYDNPNAFRDIHENYGKLIHVINNKPEWKMNIKFGTLSEYFMKIRRQEKAMQLENAQYQFPVISGDFFPYSDFDGDVWTGYFTTRIWLKRFVREIEPLIRMADAYSVMLYAKCVTERNCTGDVQATIKEIVGNLRNARRDVGMFQHHDGITGTSLPFVVSDYESRLEAAYLSASNALSMTLAALLSRGKVTSSSALVNGREKGSSNLQKRRAKDLLTHKSIKIQPTGTKLVVVNSLERKREEIVSFLTDKNAITITDASGNNVEYQRSEPTSNVVGQLLISFRTTLQPFQITTFTVKIAIEAQSAVEKEAGSSEFTIIENRFLKVYVNKQTGLLEQIVDSKGKTTVLKSTFLKYAPKKSGAYLFGPQGEAQPISSITSSTPQMKVIQGEMYSEVRVRQAAAGFTQTFTLYNVDDVKGTGLYITNEITMAIDQSLTNAEIVMRFDTNVENNNIFYTDLNGFQMMGRKHHNMSIEMNYFPITSMAILEDSERRITLHSAQSHGVASLARGQLEVMLDRNVRKDDGKGLGQGVNEKELVLTEFVVQIEHMTSSMTSEEPRYTYPSAGAIAINEQLQSKVQLFSIEQNADAFDSSFQSFQDILPCDVFIVGLRLLAENDLHVTAASLVLHRKSLSCELPVGKVLCSAADTSVPDQQFLNSLGFSAKKSSLITVEETSLSHLHKIGSQTSFSDIRPMPHELRTFRLKFY